MIQEKNWWIYKGTGEPHNGIERLPPPPIWRTFSSNPQEEAQFVLEEQNQDKLDKPMVKSWKEVRGEKFQISAGKEELDLINTALLLRRPLFVTGTPGSGKSTLAYAIAHELNLGEVLYWPITTRVNVKDGGLYQYDAIARLEAASLASKAPMRNNEVEKRSEELGRYIRLGPLGTALLPTRKPRVLLIDEIDKGDVDLPNDLLNIFEEGEFEIRELERVAAETPRVLVKVHSKTEKNRKVWIERGHVRCNSFPIIILTSNGERDFPPAFLRRCIYLHLKAPDEEMLTRIVEALLALKPEDAQKVKDFITKFAGLLEKDRNRAIDQLLNVIYLATNARVDTTETFLENLQQPLTAISSDEN